MNSPANAVATRTTEPTPSPRNVTQTDPNPLAQAEIARPSPDRDPVAIFKEALSQDNFQSGLTALEKGNYGQAIKLLDDAQTQSQRLLVLLPGNKAAQERLEQSCFWGAHATYLLLGEASAPQALAPTIERLLSFVEKYPRSENAAIALQYLADTLSRPGAAADIKSAIDSALPRLAAVNLDSTTTADFHNNLAIHLHRKAIELAQKPETAQSAVALFLLTAELPNNAEAPAALYNAAATTALHLDRTEGLRLAQSFIAQHPQHELSPKAREIIFNSHYNAAVDSFNEARIREQEAVNPAELLELHLQTMQHLEFALKQAPLHNSSRSEASAEAYDLLMATTCLYNEKAAPLGRHQEIHDLALDRMLRLIADDRVSRESSILKATPYELLARQAVQTFPNLENHTAEEFIDKIKTATAAARAQKLN